MEVVDEDRSGDPVHVRGDEDAPEPLDEEPPVVVGREDRSPLVGAHHDAQDVARGPPASLSRHILLSLGRGYS